MYSSLDTMKYTKSNAGAMKMRSWARRRFLKYFCFLLLLTLLPLIYYRKAILLTLRRHHYLFQYQTPDLDEPKHIPLMNVSDADLTIRNSSVHEVLLWNPFFGDSLYVKPLNSSVCPQIKCMFTADRNRFDSANAIIFHLPDFKGNDLPRYKPANQIWILLCQESPSNYQYRTILSSFNNHIDLVATYRFESDIYLNPRYRRRFQPLSRNNTDFTKGKEKMAAWFVSNCRTPGKREEFVAELEKYIPIDIYGRCGMNECKPRMSQDCYDMISKKYYFYLSFENSLCKDYVTEKFFNVLEQPLIPVVYGGANYTQILPAKGYINALSFESPKSLAKELIRIASDPELYNSYFEWKSYFEQEPDPGWSCRLCSILHQPTTHRTRWTQLHHFWYDDANCIYPNYSF